MAGESSALNLLWNYESSSDSERDSGYTSEEDKKRKCISTVFENGHKFKRRRIEDMSMEEDMIVDTPVNPADRIQSLIQNDCQNDLKHLRLDKYDGPSSSRSNNVNRKQSFVIPLPKELAVEGPSHVDDACKHQNRVRSFPHDPGNWAAIIYFPLHEGTSEGEGYTSYDTLHALVSDVVELCRTHNLHLTPSTDFHISLSKTLQLRLHTIQPLAHHIRVALTNVARFTVWLNKFAVYVNEEKTRTFLGLRVLTGHTDLAAVVRKLDRLLETYQLPSFYKDCSLHASVAWVAGDQSALLQSILPALHDHFSDYFSDADHLRSFQARHLHFKAGNRVHSIQLGPYSS